MNGRGFDPDELAYIEHAVANVVQRDELMVACAEDDEPVPSPQRRKLGRRVLGKLRRRGDGRAA